MDRFVVNFDVLGGLGLDESLEEDETNQKKERFVPISDEELNQLELSRNERTTARSTSWAVRCFQDYLKTTKQVVDFQTVTKEELNRILREFYGSARNSHGQHYSISSYVGLRAGINRYINDPPLGRAWCLMQDTEFSTSNKVFSGLIKSLRRAGCDKTEHHAAITKEDLIVLRQSEAMNPNTARGLVNKVWFDIQLHFGKRGKEGLRKLTPQSFEIKRDSTGTKYVTLSFNKDTKHHKHCHERGRSRRGAMFEDQGNELCPVSSFEKYISKIPKEAKAFYLHPKKGERLGNVWYSMEPMGVNYLGSMLSRLSKEAGTSVIYTNHCIRSTTIQKLSEGEPKAREIMTDSGHRSESSRQSYWAPSVDNRKQTSGLKRTLSEGYENDGQTVKREGKRPKVEREELEAQLELKITAKAGSHHKLGKIVQQLVNERLRVLELTVFDKHFQELKDRVDKIECATKHQMAINTLQAKIARLAKKFGEANQASENQRKQEALTAAAAAAISAKTATVTNNPQAQRPIWTSMEVKQTPTTVSSSNAAVITAPPVLPAPAMAPAPISTSTAVVQQAPILQLITSSSNAASTLATGITTQSPTGTLLLKTATGSSMVATGQPLLIQLPLSVNGQAGTLVNIPVSSLSAANSLNKAKTTASTTTFILKPAPITTTAPASAPASATAQALQASPGQMSPAQISLARAVYQGGTGGISTPNAGVSVTTARTPAQSVSVVGAMSSVSSPATSGPAATGSAAPGPPQGTSLTSKTDNQASGTTHSKAAPPAPRPKGSVNDLTEDDDDDVQVTGVKNVSTPPSTPRSNPVISILNSTGARSSPQTPQSNQNSTSHPQLTVHHRPQLESSVKSRAVTTTTQARGPSMPLPPLPVAPAPPRLPPEAERTTPPQQPQLKLVPSQTGIVLSWCVAETDRTCAAVESYHLYAFHQDNSNSSAAQQHWKKIGEVKALPLPMACTLTQFQSGSTYHFAVRAKDIYGRFGSFCEPQCTNVISSNSS